MVPVLNGAIADRVATAATGFLLAVLWFDLMFDVQVLRHRGEERVPEPVLDSIGAYYRRVTIDASPMGRLVAVTMVALLVALGVQAVGGTAPGWVVVVSFAGAALGPGLAGVRVVPAARRLGRGADDHATRSALARGIARDHLVCLAAMLAVLTAQLAA